MAKLKVVFLGIGLMGKPMATRLLRAGFSLTIWNRTKEKCNNLIELGAEIVTTPIETITNSDHAADIIITMLADGSVVDEMIRQILPILHGHEIWIDMSSTQQAEAQRFNEVLGTKNVRFIDAPVSGE